MPDPRSSGGFRARWCMGSALENDKQGVSMMPGIKQACLAAMTALLLLATLTARICGTTDISLSARRIRNARDTENAPLDGSRAAATIAKSNRFQPLRKNLGPWAMSFRAISVTNITSAVLSMKCSRLPAVAIAVGDVSSPSVTALMPITTLINVANRGWSINVRRRPRMSVVAISVCSVILTASTGLLC